MLFQITTPQVNHLGFAATFLCMSLGFICMQRVVREERGPIIWSLSCLLNSIGFILWSGKIDIAPWQYYLFGEIAHMAGFIILAIGVRRFLECKFSLLSVVLLISFILLWILVICGFNRDRTLSVFCLRVLRTLLFLYCAISILRTSKASSNIGNKLTISSLVLWGLYNICYGFIKIEGFNDYIFGILVGLHVLTAFGLVTMVVGRIYTKAEKNVQIINKLERLLPMCAHCRRIRDTNKEWHSLESYIELNTTSQFSHGICPECLNRYYPEYADKVKD